MSIKNGGITDGLRPFLLGWRAYFRLAQTTGVWRELDGWIRHRLRAIQPVKVKAVVRWIMQPPVRYRAD